MSVRVFSLVSMCGLKLGINTPDCGLGRRKDVFANIETTVSFLCVLRFVEN
jgi:hypothetical protein